MESTDSLQVWKALQGKLRDSGANSVYSARELLVQKSVNQQRKEQPDTLGVVHELSPSNAPTYASSTNTSSYYLRRAPSSEHAISLPVGMQPSQEASCSTTVGLKYFENEVVGGPQPGRDDFTQDSPQTSDSSSPFDGLLFIRSKTKGRRWSMGSEPFVVPSSKGTITSDRSDAFHGDHRHQCHNAEQSSLISILTDKWTRTTREGTDVKERRPRMRIHRSSHRDHRELREDYQNPSHPIQGSTLPALLHIHAVLTSQSSTPPSGHFPSQKKIACWLISQHPREIVVAQKSRQANCWSISQQRRRSNIAVRIMGREPQKLSSELVTKCKQKIKECNFITMLC
ncbi:hypothetical protein MHU86_14729 [Fragilaria crotonensis]|nr:hypothetical protein MHU86_14729 [Fragilaria crotonensis]